MVRVSSELTVPDGVGEGDILHVDIDGLSLDVPVPAGVASGETFVFEYERPDDAAPASETWPPPESSWPSGDSLLMAAVRSRRLTPDNAQALTDIMEALYDADELDDYIDDHAAEFAAYSPDGEQRLEWTSIHNKYVSLVEQIIHEMLLQLGATTTGLYTLLSEVAGGDERASAFLERLLGLGDYAKFCAGMRDGGKALKISGLDLTLMTGGKRQDFHAALANRYGISAVCDLGAKYG